MSYKVIGEALKKVFEKNMKSVKVTYDTGDVETTSVNGAMSDEEIKDYFKIGTEFNIGSVEDKMATVTDVEILGSDVNEYVEASGARVDMLFEDDDQLENVKLQPEEIYSRLQDDGGIIGFKVFDMVTKDSGTKKLIKLRSEQKNEIWISIEKHQSPDYTINIFNPSMDKTYHGSDDFDIDKTPDEQYEILKDNILFGIRNSGDVVSYKHNNYMD